MRVCRCGIFRINFFIFWSCWHTLSALAVCGDDVRMMYTDVYKCTNATHSLSVRIPNHHVTHNCDFKTLPRGLDDYYMFFIYNTHVNGVKKTPHYNVVWAIDHFIYPHKVNLLWPHTQNIIISTHSCYEFN